MIMTIRSRLGRCLCALAAPLLTALAPAGVAADPCLSIDMTIDATFPNDPGHEGQWKYCISGTWDLGLSENALSHIDFLLGLDGCACICDMGVFETDSIAGTSTGEFDGVPCTVDYVSDFLCEGDPTLPPELQTVAFKFEQATGQDCETGTSGEGTWCFYSFLAPAASATHTDAVVIKYGGMDCTGDLVGTLPGCGCAVPVEPSTWSRVKSYYR
jgi:hypothetical protein